MESSPDYKKAYETAAKELAEIIAKQDELENRKIVLRRGLESLAALCEQHGIDVEASQAANYILQKTDLVQEIRAILRERYPGWQRPHQVWTRLSELGRDMSEYNNPQSAIQMVLKRLADSDDVQENTDAEAKKIYRCPPVSMTLQQMAGKMPPYDKTTIQKISKTQEISDALRFGTDPPARTVGTGILGRAAQQREKDKK